MGHELNVKLKELNDLLSAALADLKQRGIAKASAERDYKVIRAQETLKLRAEGFPATLIHDEFLPPASMLTN